MIIPHHNALLELVLLQDFKLLRKHFFEVTKNYHKLRYAQIKHNPQFHLQSSLSVLQHQKQTDLKLWGDILLKFFLWQFTSN